MTLARDPPQPADRPRTYPLPQVLTVLHMCEATFTNWTIRGHYGLVIEPSGRGRVRRLKMEDVWRLAFIKAITGVGIAISTAALLADECLTRMRCGNVETMTVYDRPGSFPVVEYDGVALEHGHAWTALTLHVSNVTKSIEQALQSGTPL